MTQAALFDLPPQVAPSVRTAQPRRRRERVEQVALSLPGSDATPRPTPDGRDLEWFVRCHQRALRARRGERETRRALLDRVRPIVTALAGRRWRASYQRVMQHDDAVQEAQLWVAQQIDRYRGTQHVRGSMISAWLRMLVSQRLAEVAAVERSPVRLTRTQRRELRAEQEAAAAEGLEVSGPVGVELDGTEQDEATPEGYAMQAQDDAEADADAQGMWRLVQRLDVRRRRLVRRVHRDGLELSEAVEREGLSQRVGRRLYREALEQLREWARC